MSFTSIFVSLEDAFSSISLACGSFDLLLLHCAYLRVDVSQLRYG